MKQENSRRTFKGAVQSRNSALSRNGVDRVSCAWRDAVGPGYAVGVTERIARTVSVLDAARYCHR